MPSGTAKARISGKAEHREASCRSVFGFFAHSTFLGNPGTMVSVKCGGGTNMGIVKQLTLDRYEHGLMVRALYDLRKQMLTENKPTEDIEDLLLKVIDAPRKKKWRILR